MLKIKELENGMVEVSSSIKNGMVDIGNGAVAKIICMKEEVEYIEEVNEE